ncbi:glycosyltransferase family 2 protein [Neisseriaceae bacterium JH1-16]|nr:glycosyltransferase family 2 protein [Neisseriaceae bacterium JH1-16]
MSTKEHEDIVLSICIPTFNRARYLESLLGEVVANIQKLEFSYEILIGDNCSEDTTPHVVEGFQDRLNIRYFRRPNNIGSGENLNQLYRSAKGRYCLYLADDDLPILDEVSNNIATLDANPGVGVIFAPWAIHDKPSGQDVSQFYTLDGDYLIETRDYSKLLALLVTRHIFPEIYMARREVLTSLYFTPNKYAFWAFVHIAEMLGRYSVYFSAKPFYRSVSRYFEDETRTQAGMEEVKDAWDRYRGGLEYLFGKFAGDLSAEEKAEWQGAIDQFVLLRMSVALRIRTQEGKNWIDNYFIANRIRCLGGDQYLPVPYDVYRVNAAFEHFATLTPFLPQQARRAYLQSAPPQVFNYAQEFNNTEFLVLENEHADIPANTLVLSQESSYPLAGRVLANVISLSEGELLAQFP